MKFLNRLLLIEEDEGSTVFYFLIFFIVVGFGMILGHATANSIFLKRVGVDYLPVMYLVQGSACFITSLLYASIADVLPTERMFKIIFSVLATIVLVFWILLIQNVSGVVFPAYFLFYEVISEVMLIHSALYLNQNLNTLQAKRLSPIIFSGHQIGAILGGIFVAVFAPLIGTNNILIVWCVLLLTAMGLITFRHRLIGTSPYFRPVRTSANKLKHTTERVLQGFKFAKTSELLRYSTIAMVFMVITYYIISYSVKRIYSQNFIQESDLTSFFGILSTTTSSVALILQLFITNRLIRRFGIPTINIFYPMASLASFVGMLSFFGLPTAIVSSINIKSFMPAIYNPVRSIFLNVLPQQIQGRARSMFIAIVLPVSLTFCGILLLFLQKFHEHIYILIPGVIAAMLFLYFSVRMNRAYGNTLLTHLKEHLYLPEDQSAISIRHTGKDNIEEVIEAIRRGDKTSVSFARILIEAYPEEAVNHILPVIKQAPNNIANQLLKLVCATKSSAINQFLIDNLDAHDDHFRATALTHLASCRIKGVEPMLRAALEDPNPRVRATAIFGVLYWPLEQLREQAIDNWIMLQKGSDHEQIAALENVTLIKLIPVSETRDRIKQACMDSCTQIFPNQDNNGKCNILKACSYLSEPVNNELQKLITQAIDDTDPKIRAAAMKSIHLLPHDQYYQKLQGSLGDGHALVRKAAVDEFHKRNSDAPKIALEWIIEENRGTPRAQKTLLSSVINDIPKTTLENIVDNKIKDARQIYLAMVTIRNQNDGKNNAMSLLKFLLEERLQQIIEIAIIAMEPLCERNVISIIRAGIETHDVRYMANACEALDSIHGQKHNHELSLLVQEIFMNLRQTTTLPGGNIVTVLESLSSRPDGWLQDCANAALYNLEKHNV